MFAFLRHLVPAALLALFFVACGSSPEESGAFTPGEHAPAPEVVFEGGAVMTHPEVVTVTFQGDPYEATLQAFGAFVTTSKWWDAVTAEYCGTRGCIGHGTARAPVVLTEPAKPHYTLLFLQSLLKTKFDDGTLGVPTRGTLYVVYFPAGTNFDDGAGGESCQAFGGYHTTHSHDRGIAAQTIDVPVAFIPRCDGDEAAMTRIASHEIVEAATDPVPDTGWAALTTGRDSFGEAGGIEVADLCTITSDLSATQVQEGGFFFQRSWSNASARAGHDPCVPIPTDQVYFNSAPKEDDVALRIGESATLELQGFSDAPTADWSLDFLDGSESGHDFLTVSSDRSTLNNGLRAKLTVTLVAPPKRRTAVFYIVSKQGDVTRYWVASVRPIV